MASEGLVAISTAGRAGAVIEINAETDFVARNDQFQAFVTKVADIALETGGNVETINNSVVADGGTIADELKNLVAIIGENMNLRRAAALRVDDGIVASYVHNATAANLGRIGVLVGLESQGDKEKLAAFGRQLAMHVAAAAPQWNDIADVDAAVLERERTILADQAKASGKPVDIVEKMVEGRLRKFYEEVVFLEQVYVIDGESKVKMVIDEAAKDVGAPVKATGFVRYVLGEGVEREESEFAA